MKTILSFVAATVLLVGSAAIGYAQQGGPASAGMTGGSSGDEVSAQDCVGPRCPFRGQDQPRGFAAPPGIPGEGGIRAGIPGEGGGPIVQGGGVPMSQSCITPMGVCATFKHGMYVSELCFGPV